MPVSPNLHGVTNLEAPQPCTVGILWRLHHVGMIVINSISALPHSRQWNAWLTRSKLPAMARSLWWTAPTQEPFRSHPESIHRTKDPPITQEMARAFGAQWQELESRTKYQNKRCPWWSHYWNRQDFRSLVPEPGAETITCSLFNLTITFCLSHLSLPHVLKSLDFCFSAYTRKFISA